MRVEKPMLFWVIGAGGLLGSRVSAAIESDVPGAACWKSFGERLSWGKPAVLSDQLDRAAGEFAEAVRRRGGGWGVVWAAGAGVVGTSDQLLQAETATWETVLRRIDVSLVSTNVGPGVVFLVSSAGGVYGNCPDQVITETSESSPISAYGRNKLRQERLFQDWADRHPDVICRVGRVSNLYGPGQNLTKTQGLVSHISRSLIWQVPVHLYVPLDTMRDYLYVDDCANQIAYCLRVWSGESRDVTQRTVQRVKIFAAGESTTVARIIGEFKRLAMRRHPRVICAPSPLGLQQPRRLQFQSIVGPDLRHLRQTTLHVGVSRVYLRQLALYHEGRLRPPAGRA